MGGDAHPPHCDAMMTDLGSSSKLNAEWDFLIMLRDEGRHAADEFLTAHGEDIGKRSTARSRCLAGQSLIPMGLLAFWSPSAC